jgi:hypothetical protein
VDDWSNPVLLHRPSVVYCTVTGEGGSLLHGGEEFHKEQLFLYKGQGLAFQIESNLIDQKLLGIALKQD